METLFVIEKNNKSIKSLNSYQTAFKEICELIEKEHSKYKYIRKSQLSDAEFKEVKDYYKIDGLYAQQEKVFGFGNFVFTAEKDSYLIKSK